MSHATPPPTPAFVIATERGYETVTDRNCRFRVMAVHKPAEPPGRDFAYDELFEVMCVTSDKRQILLRGRTYDTREEADAVARDIALAVARGDAGVFGGDE